MPNDPIALLKQANTVVIELLEHVTPEQMTLPTVNDEWDVRALINHLVVGNQWPVQALKSGSAPRPSGDAIGDRSPRDAYAESAQALLAAFAEPGALDRVVQMPFGEMSGMALAGLRFNDAIAHAWDLAQATGQETDIAPELCEIALTMARQRLEGRERSQTPFKESVPVPAGARTA